MQLGTVLVLVGTAILIWLGSTLSMLEPAKLQSFLNLFSLC
jgi:hypothetical protein